MATLTFSQAILATVTSVRQQMANTGSKTPSTSLLRRHAIKHVGSSNRRLIAPVIEAARDEILSA